MPRPSVSASGPGAVSAGGDITGDVTTYAGTLQGTPLAVATQNLDRIFELVRVTDFAGRRWLERQLDDFLDGQDRGYFLVEAEAGLGKTTFAAWLVAQRHWLGHFTRLSGGRYRRSALLNLAAQLIADLDLFPDIEVGFVLPGLDRSLVPEWAGDPANFARLLDLAATKAATLDRTITLVVDGLDEERPATDPVQLGLPTSLPAGVYVVATCRVGTAVNVEDTAFTVARIAAEDPRNLADMRAFVTAQAGKKDLANRLAGAGMTVDDFVDRITDRCGGVWIYLSHLLSDLRTGALELADLDRLPARLSQYFATNLLRRQQEPEWPTEDLPLLGVLAAVFEPVGTGLLADVTGIAPTAVRRVCEQRYRAFLRVVRAARVKRFAVYHRSLGDFLAGSGVDEGGVPESTRDVLDELAEHARAAHKQISDLYLSSFADDPRRLASQHGGYGLRHLTSHLRHAGRHDVIRKLLGPNGSVSENRWLKLHLDRGDIGPYIRDVTAELGPARVATDALVTLTERAESLRFEVFATLFLAGQTAEPGDIPVDLLDPLLAFGVWDVDNARAQVDTVRHPALRSAGLLAIVPHLAAADRVEPVREAQAAADAVVNRLDRVLARANLLEHLDPAAAVALRAEMEQDAGGIADPLEAGRALLALQRHDLDADRQRVVADLLHQENDPVARLYGLCEAVPYGPPITAGEVLDLADEVMTMPTDDDLIGLGVVPLDHRTAIMVQLLDHVDPPTRATLWTAAMTAAVPGGLEGVDRLVALARHAADRATRQRLVRSALALAREIPDARVAARAMLTVRSALA